MRTTIDIEEDVLIAVKELARLQKISAGQVVSRLLRQALTKTATGINQQARSKAKLKLGFRPFASRGKIVTGEQIDRLRDQEGV